MKSNILIQCRMAFLGLFLAGPSITLSQLSWEGCGDLDHSQFEKTTLVGYSTDDNLQEPTKINLDANGDIYISLKRKGEIWKLAGTHYNMKVVLGTIPIYSEAFHGLLGFALSENYLENGWIYTLSSPLDVNDPSTINPAYKAPGLQDITFRLSRFTVTNESLDPASEKIILEIPTEVMEGHQGGDVVINDGYIYLTTGNDSWAIQSPTPNTDEADAAYNSLRSSANTNDLRGKVLKLKLKNLPDSHPREEWGAGVSYDIPEGNLFPPGTPDTRPEVFAMGLRNPYTMYVDNDRVYVADVGPQGNDPNEHGPSGGDQFYISDVGANFGYPMFVNGIEPCKILDADKNILGEYDPDEPRNTSIFNTGLELLPVPVPAAAVRSHNQARNDINGWYTAGSMSLMAGPVYHYNGTSTSPGKFPPHFEGKWIVGDYALPNLKVAVTEGNEITDMIPLFEHISLTGPVGMRFGPDGALYVVEYSNVWNNFNAGTMISKITYTGDCSPVGVGQQQGRKVLTASERKRVFLQSRILDLPQGVKAVKIYSIAGELLWSSNSIPNSSTITLPDRVINKLAVLEVEND